MFALSVCLKDACLSRPLQPLGAGVWGWLPDGSSRPFHCPWTLSLWVSLPSPFSGRSAAAFLLSPSPLLRPLGLLHLHHLLLLPRLVKMSERNPPSPAVWGPGWTSTPACGQHGGMPPSDHLGSFRHFPPLCPLLHSGCLAYRSSPHPQSLLPSSACLLVPAPSPALPDPWPSPPRSGPRLPLTWLTAPPCPFLLFWCFHPYLSLPPTFPPPFLSLPSFSPSSPSLFSPLWVFFFPLFIPSSLLLYNLQGRLGTPGIFPGRLVGRLLPSPEPQAVFRAGMYRHHREHLPWYREPKSPEWWRVPGWSVPSPASPLPYPLAQTQGQAAQPIVFLVGLSHCDSLENTGG